MDPDVITFAAVSLVIVCLVASLAAIGITVVRLLPWATRRKSGGSHLDDQRLEQLQQSVDAIAVEVERIAEAQRFTAKLMVEREGVPKLG